MTLSVNARQTYGQDRHVHAIPNKDMSKTCQILTKGLQIPGVN
jgi:hypothetical protein